MNFILKVPEGSHGRFINKGHDGFRNMLMVSCPGWKSSDGHVSLFHFLPYPVNRVLQLQHLLAAGKLISFCLFLMSVRVGDAVLLRGRKMKPPQE